MPAKHVEGEPGHVEHEGGHQDVVGHGQDLARDGHVLRMGQIEAICGVARRNKKSGSE